MIYTCEKWFFVCIYIYARFSYSCYIEVPIVLVSLIWFKKMFTLNSFNFLLFFFFFFFLLLIGMELNIKYLERNYNRNINHEKKILICIFFFYFLCNSLWILYLENYKKLLKIGWLFKMVLNLFFFFSNYIKIKYWMEVNATLNCNDLNIIFFLSYTLIIIKWI